MATQLEKMVEQAKDVTKAVISDTEGLLNDAIENSQEIFGGLLNRIGELGIADLKAFAQENDAETFRDMLSQYATTQEVQTEVDRVQQLVREGYVAEDLGLAVIKKITGETGIVDSKEHRSMVPLADARRAIDLMYEQVEKIENDGLSGDDLYWAKADFSLRTRIAFDDGGLAAVTNYHINGNSETVFQDQLFDESVFGMSEEELWEKYRYRIVKLAETDPSSVRSYLSTQGLGEARENRANQQVAAEMRLLNHMFSDQLGAEKQARRDFVDPDINPLFGQTTLDTGFSSLLNFISKGEGGYNSMNRGTSGGRIVGSTHNAAEQLGKDLTDMTIGEIMDWQAKGVFAVGRYQIIPSTMKLALEYSGLSRDDMFSEENQDRMAISLMMFKRPVVGEFLRGNTDVSIDQAMLHIAMEWASLPDPRTGASYYGHGNKALHSVAEVRSALLKAREEIAENGMDF